MTIEHFGKVMPIHCGILSLIGWHLSRGESYLIADQTLRVAEMRLGHRELVLQTGHDFGFDLSAWREYLLANSEEYKHPYAFSSVDRAVRDAIADPTFAQLSQIAATEPRRTRSSSGAKPDPKYLEEVAIRLGRPVCVVDDNGYECELIGGAISPAGEIAYVESRAKDIGFNQLGENQREIDISIRVHLLSQAGQHELIDIESYNPFFGCRVRLFEWIEQTAILIYREKHDTYACRFGDIWPPVFVEIEDRWVITDKVLAYIGYQENSVRRLSFPELTPLDSLSIAEAERMGQLPPKR